MCLFLLCREYNIENYIINNDDSIDVFGDVRINRHNIDKIPIKFRNVYGDFCCYSNKLTTLENCPVLVEGDFVCSWNKLTNLKGSPSIVYGDYYCHNNKLTSIKSGPKKLSGRFYTNKLNIRGIIYEKVHTIPSIKNYKQYLNNIHRNKIINKILKK